MIVPSIDLMGGRAVQLRRGVELEIDAGDPRPLAERFSLAGEIAVIDLDAALGQGDNQSLIRELVRIAPCRVGGGIRSRDAALEWLDAGAARVILGTAANEEVLADLPTERMVAALDAIDGEVVVDGWRERTGRGVIERMRELEGLVGGFLVTFVEVEGTLAGLPLDRVPAILEAAAGARVTVAGGIRTTRELGALDRLGADAQVGMALYSGRIHLADAIAAPLESDRPDGLWATVIEDTAGSVLGLAWSSARSLRVAVSERRGVYQSRSRGLWRKGETSGATQELVRVTADCDRDALLFTVRQAGSGFCHTGSKSCFDQAGQTRPRRVRDLEGRLRDRLASPAPGSLTARLAADADLLAGKLAEESAELARASGPHEAVAEFADLLYFGLTRLLLAGGSLEEVERELERRALRVRRRAPREPSAGVDPDPAAAGSAISSGRPARGLAEILPDASLEQLMRTARRAALHEETIATAMGILRDVEQHGEAAVREHAERLGDIEPGGPLVLSRSDLERAAAGVDRGTQDLVDRAAARIEGFARAQLDSALDVDAPLQAGRGGHRLTPVAAAGCYAPGGRYPLPSSALMTLIPARVAGVEGVWLASPRPGPVLQAAALRGGADGLLAVGGAQAIAALAFGAGIPACDVIAGPGNRYVTAAKRLLYGRVGLDMLAGPSELLVVASSDADPERVAADLLAQAEHDTDALPVLCAFEAETIAAVRDELERQLGSLPTGGVAVRALARGGALVASDSEAAARICDALAPEHLHLHGSRAEALAARVRRYGALFIGSATPEAAGDYGVGPNHTLPTGGAARHASGLSVFSFLRRPTWIELDPSDDAYDGLVRDTAEFARLEGLEAHARSAELRLDRAGRQAGMPVP